jgi:hypothetical protein
LAIAPDPGVPVRAGDRGVRPPVSAADHPSRDVAEHRALEDLVEASPSSPGRADRLGAPEDTLFAPVGALTDDVDELVRGSEL